MVRRPPRPELGFKLVFLSLLVFEQFVPIPGLFGCRRSAGVGRDILLRLLAIRFVDEADSGGPGMLIGVFLQEQCVRLDHSEYIIEPKREKSPLTVSFDSLTSSCQVSGRWFLHVFKKSSRPMAAADVGAKASRHVSPTHRAQFVLSILAPVRSILFSKHPQHQLPRRNLHFIFDPSSNRSRSDPDSHTLLTTASNNGCGNGSSPPSSRTDLHRSETRNCFPRSIPWSTEPSTTRFHTSTLTLADGRQHQP